MNSFNFVPTTLQVGTAAKWPDILQNDVFQIMLLAVLFGAYTLVTALTFYFLLRAGVRTAASRLMLFAMGLMFICVAIYFTIAIVSLPLSISYTQAIFTGTSIRVLSGSFVLLQNAAFALSCIIANMIILSRSFTLWRSSNVVVAMTVAIAALSTVSCILETVDIAREIYAKPSLFGENSPPSLALALFIMAKFIVSVWSTALVGFKSWQVRSMAFSRTLADKLSLLTKFGTIYSTVWLVVLVLERTVGVGKHSWLLSFLIILVTVYPMLIILVVTHSQTPSDSPLPHMSASDQLGLKVPLIAVKGEHATAHRYSTSLGTYSITGVMPSPGLGSASRRHHWESKHTFLP